MTPVREARDYAQALGPSASVPAVRTPRRPRMNFLFRTISAWADCLRIARRSIGPRRAPRPPRTGRWRVPGCSRVRCRAASRPRHGSSRNSNPAVRARRTAGPSPTASAPERRFARESLTPRHVLQGIRPCCSGRWSHGIGSRLVTPAKMRAVSASRAIVVMTYGPRCPVKVDVVLVLTKPRPSRISTSSRG